MPSRWQHRSFPISVPPTRRPMATTHREDTTVNIPEQGDEAEAPPRTTETEKGHIQRKKRGYTLTASALTQVAQHCTKRVPQGLLFLQWRKERPRWTPTSPSTAGPFLGGLIQSCPVGITGEICRGSEMGKGVGLTATNTQISLLVHPILTCSSGILARSSAQLQLKHLRNFIVDRWSVLQLGLTMSLETNGFNHVLLFSLLFSF